MHGEDITGKEFADDPMLGIEWNGRKWIVTNVSGDMVQIQLRDDESTTESFTFDELTERFQNEDDPFNTYR